ncbi:MAG TPA: glycosyltransferase [Thermoanaerobaculia bacterium]|nr:glycosyltransferase [Thermoanaerobaculia bacterium]
MGQLSIILVTWNSARYLRRCLEGIAQQTIRDAELIVVDNASADESLSMIPATARVIRNETNRGFSAAVNQAIAIANGELVLVVNPDCHLMPDYASKLIAVFEDPGVGSATGLLIRARGYDIEPIDEIDSLGIRMTRTGRHLDIAQGVILSRADGEGPSNAPRGRSFALYGAQDDTGPFEVFGVSGAAAMFRASFLRDACVFGEALDEDFFAYREDADLAWRGRLFGWRSICEPAAIAYHVRRVTPEARRELPADVNMHSVKNRFLLRIKNQGAYLALRHFPFELLRDLIVLIAAVTVERTSLPAFAWLWRNRKRVLAKRREIQRRRKVSDRELAKWFR